MLKLTVFRQFLANAAFAGAAAFAWSQAKETDVLVYAATPAGIASAIGAARGGANVVLVEESNHIGGIITGGLTSADIGKDRAIGGLFSDFESEVRKYYRTHYGPDAPQYRACNEGRQLEPHVAEELFQSMLSEYPGITLIKNTLLIQAKAKSGRVTQVTLSPASAPRMRTVVRAKVFIDASYEGDLAALAGARYHQGRESAQEFGEALAGQICTRVSTTIKLPGSTGAGDKAIESYCFRIFVTREAANRVPFSQPQGYRRSDYADLLDDLKQGRITRLEQVFQFQPAPNGKFALNSNHLDPVMKAPRQSFDLAEENWSWPEANRQERARIAARYWSYDAGMLWFLQNDAEVPEPVRRQAAEWGLCRDEFPDNNYQPYFLYVREARRIDGLYTFTERDEEPREPGGIPRHHEDGIAVVSYSWDCHAAHKYNAALPDCREGYFVVEHAPIEVPFGTLVPKSIEGLLVPVACSASHVGYQTIRMEPVFMQMGQAAGIAAAEAVRRHVDPHQVPIGLVQAALLNQGGVISYFEDLPADDRSARSIEFLGPRGLSLEFHAYPSRTMTESAASESLLRILSSEGIRWSSPPIAPRAISGGRLIGWIRSSGLMVDPSAFPELEKKESLTVSDFATVVAAALGARF